MRGPARIFEGEKGLFAATCPDADPARLAARPRAGWKIFETSFKPWPACRHAHPAIDAALGLRRAWMARDRWRELPLDAIAAVELRTYDDAIAFCDCPAPATAHEARFSLQHVVAVALLNGALQPGDCEPPSLGEARCASLRARVVPLADAGWSRRYPAHFGAGLTVSLHDGRVLRESVADALGDPERPLDAAAVLAIAAGLLDAAGWEAGRAARHLARVGALDGLADLAQLPPLRPGPGSGARASR